jgi:hypothetical protein
MIKIRLAGYLDLGQIVTMQVAHRKETTTYAKLTFDTELCIENMALAIQDTNHIILVAHYEDSSEILGYMWLVKVQPHYSPQFYISEIYTYINPDNRGGRVLVSLIDKCKTLSRLSGASYLELGSFSGNNTFTKSLAKRYENVGLVFNIPL